VALIMGEQIYRNDTDSKVRTEERKDKVLIPVQRYEVIDDEGTKKRDDVPVTHEIPRRWCVY
jgi:hypothetical protein